jgi:hypothetical protein
MILDISIGRECDVAGKNVERLGVWKHERLVCIKHMHHWSLKVNGNCPFVI